MSEKEMLAAAIEYTKRGWVVHPLTRPNDKGNSPGKRPLLSNWQFLTKSPDDLGAYIKKGHNIGLVCGQASDVDALDFDIDLFRGDLLNGSTVNTLSSGHREGRGHLLFQHVDDLFSEKHHFIGIEYFGSNTDGAGSNLVLPPSIHYSGEEYVWYDPEAPLSIVPQKVKDNLKELFKKEDELHRYFKKCRHCFTKGSKKYDRTDPRSKGIWDRPDSVIVHGMDGRLGVLAIVGELRAEGCPDDLLHMVCKRFFGKDYSFDQTAEALKHIKPIHPKCQTLRVYLNVECDGCSWQPQESKLPVSTGDHICGTCFFCPRGGLGNCRNPDSVDGRKKKYVIDTYPACERYREKSFSEKGKAEKMLSPIEADPDLVKAMGVYKNNLQLAEELQKIIPFYFDDSRNYWIWKNDLKYYKLIDETDILSCVRHNSVEYVVNATTKNEIIEGIRITGRERQVLAIDDSWLHFNDKGYDLKNNQTFEPKPTHFFSAPIPHNIGKSYETPTIDRLFFDWLGDAREILYEIAAYCLLDAYPIHRMFILFGGGRNGKGQFMEFLTRLVGKNNTTTTDLELLIKSRFECAKLYKKKLALVGETNFTAIADTAKLKKITGADMIGGEFKQKKPFDFYNTAKVVISSNSVPETLDKTDAFYSRTIVLEFSKRFLIETPIIDTIPEIEYENFIRRCLDIILPNLLKRGSFVDEGSIEQKTDKYEKLSDPFSTFKDRELIEDIDSDIPVWVMREMFMLFCSQNNFRRLNEKEFTQTINRAGIETKKRRFGEKTWNAVIGFRTRKPYVWDVTDGNKDITDGNKCSTCSTCSTSVDKIYHMGKEGETTGTCGTSGTLKHESECVATHPPTEMRSRCSTSLPKGLLNEMSSNFTSPTIKLLSSLKENYDVRYRSRPVDHEEYLHILDIFRGSLEVDFEDVTDDEIDESIDRYLKYRGWI